MLEFLVSLIKENGAQSMEGQGALENNCTKVTNGYWIYEGDLDFLDANVTVVGTGIVGPLGDLSLSELANVCMNEFGVDVLKVAPNVAPNEARHD